LNHRLLILLFFLASLPMHGQQYWSKNPPSATHLFALSTPQEGTAWVWQPDQWQPAAFSTTNKTSLALALPNEQSELEVFELYPLKILSERLQQKYPNIRTYAGKSNTRPGVTVRATLSPLGVSAWIQLPDQQHFFIQPQQNIKGLHWAYKRKSTDFSPAFVCKTEDRSRLKNLSTSTTAKLTATNDEVKTFRIAVTTTGEYTQHWNDGDDSNGTAKEDALAAIVNTINRVSQVYEVDLGIRLELVTGTETLFDDPTTDPFNTNFNAEAQSTITELVGEANYDLGHLFDYAADPTGDAGCIGCVCEDNQKGQAYSVHPFSSDTGPYLSDYFDLDYVAHEIGHQFGATHTFSHNVEGFGTNVEPGSGSTIMGYAGITGANNVQLHGDPYFHAKSIENILDYVATTSCYQVTAITNQAPEITPGDDYTIPKGTPYRLSAHATDPDGDLLYYTWEQMDDGAVPQEVFGPENFVGAQARSLPPSEDAWRSIPNMEAVLEGTLTEVAPNVNSNWETVSLVGRILNWTVTVRDRFANALGLEGQTVRDDIVITVADDAGPFRISSQTTTGTTWRSGARESITWEVANTDQSPINTSTISIYLSIDGGANFDVVLAENIPNTGQAFVTVPKDADTTNARIKIVPTNSIYFAVNAAAFTIVTRPYQMEFEEYNKDLCDVGTISYPFTFSFAESDGQAVQLTAEAPEGVTVTIDPSNFSNNGNGTVRIVADSNTPLGPQSLVLKAIRGSLEESFSVEYRIFDSDLQAPAPISPPNAATEIGLNTTLVWQEDLNAESYDIELATNQNFSNPILSKSVISSRLILNDLEDSTTYFWRYRSINPCGQSSYSPTQQFRTTSINCVNLSAEGLPKNLNDATSVGNGVTLASVFVDQYNVVESVRVKVRITHTYVSDLILYLLAPNGQRVMLSSEIGGSGDNYLDTVFDQSASQSILSGTPPFTGTYRPLESLDLFKGISAAGEWKLRVVDVYTQDTGSISNFELDLCLQGVLETNADEDLFVDSVDNCPFVFNNNQEDFDGDGQGDLCDLDGQNNFTLTAYDETCIGKSNGRLRIDVIADFDYQVHVLGPNGYDRNYTMDHQGLEIENLGAGTYLICISSDTDPNFERCFTTVLEAPEPMTVQSFVDPSNHILQLDVSGAANYEVTLNGISYQYSQKDRPEILLKEGANVLQVTSTIPCQGSYNELVYLDTESMSFPNPTSGAFTLLVGGKSKTVALTLRAMDGTLLRSESHQIGEQNRSVPLDISTYPPGTYLLQINTAGRVKTLKILKK